MSGHGDSRSFVPLRPDVHASQPPAPFSFSRKSLPAHVSAGAQDTLRSPFTRLSNVDRQAGVHAFNSQHRAQPTSQLNVAGLQNENSLSLHSSMPRQPMAVRPDQVSSKTASAPLLAGRDAHGRLQASFSATTTPSRHRSAAQDDSNAENFRGGRVVSLHGTGTNVNQVRSHCPNVLAADDQLQTFKLEHNEHTLPFYQSQNAMRVNSQAPTTSTHQHLYPSANSNNHGSSPFQNVATSAPMHTPGSRAIAQNFVSMAEPHTPSQDGRMRSQSVSSSTADQPADDLSTLMFRGAADLRNAKVTVEEQVGTEWGAYMHSLNLI